MKQLTEQERSDFYLSSIAKIQEEYINGINRNQLFDTILQFLLEYTGSEYGFIGAVFEGESGSPYLKTFAMTNVAWNEETRRFYDENAPEGLEFHNLDTLFGYTVKTGEVVIANDPANDPRAGGLPAGHPGMSCYLGVPIHGSSGLIAMYGMANRDGGYDEGVVSDLRAITTIMTSIIESVRNLSIIERMANRDSLTGVYNRFYIKNYIKNYINELVAKRNKGDRERFCVIMTDLNKFKHVNDYYGHEYGDYVIKEFASRIQRSTKKNDTLARIGGDEFFILLEKIDTVEQVKQVAERLISVSKKPYFIGQKRIECPASLGIACYPDLGVDFDELLRHADLALYEAKSTQSNYCFFSKEMQTQYLQRQNIEREIAAAFKSRAFFLVFQPIVDAKKEEIVGAEVLLRWKHPARGVLNPSSFIPVIDSMGLSAELNEYVIEQVVAVLSRVWLKQGLMLSINLSANVSKFDENVKHLVELLAKSKLNRSLKVNFEITETSLMSKATNLRRGSELDKLLQSHGIGLSLDDFGVQYSSINRLFDCNFSTIKIDKTFVAKLDGPEKKPAAVIIKAVIDIAAGLHVGVIAEGAETKSQVSTLQEMGCEEIQGNVFFKPMSIDELVELVG